MKTDLVDCDVCGCLLKEDFRSLHHPESAGRRTRGEGFWSLNRLRVPDAGGDRLREGTGRAD
jgi:hypothetical protein